MSWYWLDVLIIGVIALSVITGLFRGFVKELIALGVWILAIWLAFTYLSVVDHWLLPYIGDKTARTVVAFAGILFGTLIGGAIVNALLSLILRHSGLSGTDRLLGMGFGLVRGVFIVALMMLIVQLTSIPYQEFSQQSKLYARFDPLVHWLSRFMPSVIEHVKVLDKTDATKNNTVMDKKDIKPGS